MAFLTFLELIPANNFFELRCTPQNLNKERIRGIRVKIGKQQVFLVDTAEIAGF